ncbi:MAG: type III pantothenate kinase [Gammaproteobacteria bacterium]|nr:type III pantothenate kinase [Gammaproteobacteria bacterium]
MYLFLDIGNTRLKFCTSDGLSLLDSSAFPIDNDIQATLLRVWDDLVVVPTKCVIASVRSNNENAQIKSYLSQRFAIDVKFLKSEAIQCGVENAYKQFELLGVDRWLGLVAARAKAKANVLVVSCGTATTLDILRKDGRHIGGYILPGLRLMQSILNENTAEVRTTRTDFDSIEPGDSTDTCVRNAGLLACIATIEKLAKSIQADFGDPVECIVTGGDAPAVVKHLPIKVNHVPLLLFEGILEIISGTQ